MKKSIKVSTIAFPTPVWCVGTYDDEKKPNAMTIAWGGVCCSTPVSVTISLRKATYTYQSIINRGAYTISIPSAKYVAEADYLGIVSGRDTDKFRDTGLTPVASKMVDAPYIDEFPVTLECRLSHTHEIGLHTQFIGEVVGVMADQEVLDDKDRIIMPEAAPFAYGPGSREYLSVGEVIAKGFHAGMKFKSNG